MKHTKTIKTGIFYIILLCIPIISYSCGGYNPDGVTGEGSIAFKIQLQGTQDITNKPQTTDNQLSLMAAIDCTTTGISTVEGIVYDSSGTTLSSGLWNCSAHTGTINNVSAGSNRRIVINGKDSGGTIKYSGEQTGITVTANSTADAGTITLTATTITTTTGGTTNPSAPTGVSASAGTGQVTISWSSVSGATSYNIYWSTSTGVTKTTGTKLTGATSPYIHTGRTNGTTYYYVVTAVNSYGESSESSQMSGTPNWDRTTGLVGYWKMDETIGTNVADSSGYNTNGTATGTTIVSGKVGNARQGGTTNDYINLGNTLPWLSNTVGTIAVWFKSNSVTGDQVAFSTSHTQNITCGARLYLAVRDGKLYGEIGVGRNTGGQWGNCNAITWTGSTTLSTGVWYHAIFQYDGASYRLFLNGQEETISQSSASLGVTGTWFNATNDGDQQMGTLLARTYQGTSYYSPFNLYGLNSSKLASQSFLLLDGGHE